MKLVPNPILFNMPNLTVGCPTSKNLVEESIRGCLINVDNKSNVIYRCRPCGVIHLTLSQILQKKGIGSCTLLYIVRLYTFILWCYNA